MSQGQQGKETSIEGEINEGNKERMRDESRKQGGETRIRGEEERRMEEMKQG